VGTKSVVTITPASGTTITNIVLEGCAAEGKYPLRGVVFAEAKNATGVYAEAQEAVGNATTHAMSRLTPGTNPATLTGTTGVKFSGTLKGKVWGADDE
jgi:hypothetical protein